MGDAELVTVVDTGKGGQVGGVIVDTGRGRGGGATCHSGFVSVKVRTELDRGRRSRSRQDRVDVENLKVGNSRAV